MLRTLGIKSRILALAVPVAVVTALAVILGLAMGAPVSVVLLIGAIGVVGVVATVVLAGVVAASIVAPLDELGAAADEVSESLPAVLEKAQAGHHVEYTEIPVDDSGEIGRLTASVNELSNASISFAKSQAGVSKDQSNVRTQIAGMFVNVARRDQTLLKRLLSQLDQLERSEENPDTLDSLFKLDHLATRMRRNAESLLVLAGRESSRRRRQPMPLTDVVRSASSEIEHYERVDLAQYVDPAMLGHSALPTAHLLAELLENATRYSDPGSRVSVETNEGPKGIRVTIADTGLGMSTEELEKYNDRIANPPADDVIAAEKMGFYVVGRLASKLEASIVLSKGETKGTVATVDLAPALFVPGSVATTEEPDTDFGMGDTAWEADSEPASTSPEPAMLTGSVASTDPSKISVTPDFSAAASALSSMENEQLLAPEIVPSPARSGALPGRTALPGRGALPARGDKASAAPVSAVSTTAVSTTAASTAPATAAAEAPAESSEPRSADTDANQPARGAATATSTSPVKDERPSSSDDSASEPKPKPEPAPAPSAQFGAPPAIDTPRRVPSPRSDGSPTSGSGLFGGIPRREASTPGPASAAGPAPTNAPAPTGSAASGPVTGPATGPATTRPASTDTVEAGPAETSPAAIGTAVVSPAARNSTPTTPGAPSPTPSGSAADSTKSSLAPQSSPTPERPGKAPTGRSFLSARQGSDSRATASELSSLSRSAAPAQAPAPAAAPKLPIVPTGAGALDILPSGGRGLRRRKQERGAAPVPSVSAIAAAAAAPDEGYEPKAFAPPAPIAGAAAPVTGTLDSKGDSSLSDVLRARSAMASAALSELSQLSGGAPLVRRERGATEAGKAAAASQARAEAPPAPSRPTRSAADVRSMLSGFQAGVARGRDGENTGVETK